MEDTGMKEALNRLIRNASMNPTKETRSQTIGDLCNSIDEGILVLPFYQRDLCWTLTKCVDLLNYQLSGKAPVSCVSFNVINKTDIAVPQISFVTREKIQIKPGLNSVVDGQQRISTNYKAYIGSEDFRDVVLDVIMGKFLIKPRNVSPENHQIPVGVLLNRDIDIFMRYMKKHHELSELEVQTVLLSVRNKFRNYNYSINQAKDLSEEEQIAWFEVINNAGMRITDVQMNLAKQKTHNNE